MTKRILVLGDMHYGSKFAISNDPKNSVQTAILALYEDMLSDVRKQGIDGCITLGDMTDGSNYKGGGKGIDDTDGMVQIDGVVKLLSKLPTSKFYMVGGTPYHVGTNCSDDQIIARLMGAEFGEDLVVNVGGKRIHCAHKVGVSGAGTMYRPTPIAKEMMLACLNEAEYGKFDVILRGHAHYYVSVGFSSSQGVICPCWKGRDEFAQSRSLGMNPHLGYVILNIGDEVSVEPHISTLKKTDLFKEVVV